MARFGLKFFPIENSGDLKIECSKFLKGEILNYIFKPPDTAEKKNYSPKIRQKMNDFLKVCLTRNFDFLPFLKNFFKYKTDQLG